MSEWQAWRPVMPPSGVEVEVKLSDGQIKAATYTPGDQLRVAGWYPRGSMCSIGGVVSWRYAATDRSGDHK